MSLSLFGGSRNCCCCVEIVSEVIEPTNKQLTVISIPQINTLLSSLKYMGYIPTQKSIIHTHIRRMDLDVPKIQ